MGRIERCSIRFLYIMKVIWNQDVHRSAIEKASFADGDHLRLLEIEVPCLQDPRRVRSDSDGCSRFLKQGRLFENLCLNSALCRQYLNRNERNKSGNAIKDRTVTLWPARRSPIPALSPAMPAPTMVMSMLLG